MSNDQFRQTEDQYFLLKGQLETGRITRAQFDAALKELMIQDAQGRYWMIGADSGKWYVHNGQAWVEAEPTLPRALEGRGGEGERGRAATPTYPAPAIGAKNRNTLLVAVAVAAAVLLVGAIAVFFLVTQGPLKIAQATPTIAPFPTVIAAVASPTNVVIVITATPPALPTTALTATPAVTPTLSAADFVAQADALVFQSKFEQAAALYQRATEADKTNTLAYARWARLLDYQAYLEMRNDLYTQAVSKAETAASLAPNDAEVAVRLSRAYDWSGVYDKALAAAQKAIQLAPNSAEAYAVLAEVELDNAKLADAERDAQKAVQLDPNSAEAHRILGYILVEKKQNQSAIAEFDKAAQLESNLAVRHFELGAMYRSAADFARAIPALDRSIALYPRNVRAYGSLGVIYRDQKQYEKSIEAYNTGIKINDQVSSLYLGLGQSYLAAGNLPAAKEAAQKGAALDPSNQNIKNLIASITTASASPTPTVTRTPAPTPTPPLPPGLYVNNLRIEPAPPKRNQDIGFYATFLNTAGGEQNMRWLVYIYRPDARQPFGQTTPLRTSFPVGALEQRSLGMWKLTGGGGCDNFIARVVWLDEGNTPREFKKPDGAIAEWPLTVCP